jgi:hypothetical protein
MIDLLLVLTLAMPQQAPFDTDTAFAVGRGTRLKLHNQGGDITIKAWDRDQVRIQGDHASRTVVDADIRGQVLEVSAKGRRGLASMVDYQITVPSWMAVDVGGMYAEISVEGTRAAIKAQTLEGNIVVRGGADNISLQTINGRIDLSGARGRIELNAVSDDILVTDVRGDLIVESVSGSIDMRQVDAASVDAQTISGDIVFDGRIAGAGSYSLVSHSGDVQVAVPEGTNATVSVSSANGDISTSFDVTSERESRRRQTYRLGNGGANIDIETFSGDVDLLRPSELVGRRREADTKVKARINRPNRSGGEREPPDDDDHDDDHADGQHDDNAWRTER